jgi:magnesium transporter
MLEVRRSSTGNGLEKLDTVEAGCWINLVAPTEEELRTVQEALEIEPDFLRHPLDAEERSRVEIEERQVLVMVDVPIVEGTMEYSTIPLGIIIKDGTVITVCLKPTPILAEFSDGRVKGCSPGNRNRFIFQILMKTASYYHRYLKTIHKATEEIEDRLQKSMKNTELVILMNLEKSLVYFSTSIRGNELVLEKLARLKMLDLQEDDEELLQDVIIENKQAQEMGDIYSGILSGMMDAFASIINNNVSRVMKFLTIVTIALAVPTMASSFYGMNLSLPMQDHPNTFALVLGFSLTASLVLGFILGKLKLG